MLSYCRKPNSCSVAGATVGIGTAGAVPARIVAATRFAEVWAGAVRKVGTVGVSVHVLVSRALVHALGPVLRMSVNMRVVHWNVGQRPGAGRPGGEGGRNR